MGYELWAPECALPDCTNKVHYHKKDGNSYKWKMFCSQHRGKYKSVVDKWKLTIGCQNIDAHHGFKCTSNITTASQLDVNHKDGDRHNQNADNLEILCRVCHQRVTIDNNHHTNRYINQTYLNPNLWSV